MFLPVTNMQLFDMYSIHLTAGFAALDGSRGVK